MKGDICRIKNCIKKVSGKTGRVCSMHLARFWRSGGDFNYISPNWKVLKKGIPCLTKLGYIRINVNGKRVFQHRYIMEQHIGRKLKRNEVVHHINHNKIDNQIKNLKLFKNQAEHIHTHTRLGTQYSPKIISTILKRISSKQKYKNCFCGRILIVRGLCLKHYLWAHRHGFC